MNSLCGYILFKYVAQFELYWHCIYRNTVVGCTCGNEFICCLCIVDITPPGMIPRKGKYMEKDLQRLKELYCVPLNLPSVRTD